MYLRTITDEAFEIHINKINFCKLLTFEPCIVPSEAQRQMEICAFLIPLAVPWHLTRRCFPEDLA
jgi:hypothetical protein